MFFTDSPYRQLINNAILYLGQRGILAALKKKWWQEIGGGLCIKDDDDKTVNLAELGMANVGGLFVLLMCGCAATLFTAVCEFFWNIREVAVKEKVRNFFLSSVFALFFLIFMRQSHEFNYFLLRRLRERKR